METPTGDVLIVTVAYNSSGVLGDFLDSVSLITSDSVRTVVVDNASEDADLSRAATVAAGATFIGLTENRGYGGGIMAGLSTVNPVEEFLLIANPDVSFHEGSLDALIDAARRHPDAAAFGPRILTDAGDTYPSARLLPSLRTGIGHALFFRWWPQNPWTRKYVQGTTAVRERTAEWLSGACILIRRDVFDALGGFDESYFMYFEDVDLGARVTAGGWSNIYCPDAVITHTGAHSTGKSSSRMLLEHHKSAYRYLSRKYSAWYLAPLRLVLKISLKARYWWTSRADRLPRA